MMNNTVSKIERIHGDLKQIVDGLPDENEIAKYYGKDVTAFLSIMIGRIKNVR